VSLTDSLTGVAEPRLLAAARAGDEQAFRTLVAPHVRALHLHSYRMLGSYDDADEAVQEVLFRAWRGLATYAGRAPLLHWLQRITTTTCLQVIRARGRRPVGEPTYLQPYPDRLLDELTDPAADPAAVVATRDSVALAFVSALQRLPATQRAVLILRDVLDFSARETAGTLATTVAAVNSALQRARAALPAAPALVAPLSASEQGIVDRFVRAWQHRDIDALSAVLRDDVTLHMPPEAAMFAGRAAVTHFFATVPADGRLDLIDLVPTRANGQPALAAYLPTPAGECRGYGVMVLAVTTDGIASITGFPDPALFGVFDLPLALPGQRSRT
jgi:RNA polymerase sigma-70 factor (ECF subfamily)